LGVFVIINSSKHVQRRGKVVIKTQSLQRWYIYTNRV